MAKIKAVRLIFFIVEKTFSSPVFDMTKYKSEELIVSLIMIKDILFTFRTKDLLYHVDWFSLAFMINPYEHLS